MKWHFEFICACGARWGGSVPKKFQTKESGWFAYALAAWKKEHGDHVYKVFKPK